MISRMTKTKQEKKNTLQTPNGVNLVAGNLYGLNVLANIGCDATVNGRVGSTINLDKVVFRIRFSTLAGVTTRFRMIVFWSDMVITNASSFGITTSGSVTANWPLLGPNTAGNTTHMPLTVEKSTVVKDYCFVVNAQSASAAEAEKVVTCYFKSKKITFQEPAAPSLLEGKQLYLAVLSDAGAATLGTTSTGSMNCTYQIFFRE
uniref:Coat protein n=1 Tax=Grus japonensis CRESS-DNA-virus sp. TaxID=2815045 RepID=A0A8A4XCJ4_9VIRU|nr:MAG: hypothetical protein [Grus japonensis CRESS-DNA-virus sp.]